MSTPKIGTPIVPERKMKKKKKSQNRKLAGIGRICYMCKTTFFIEIKKPETEPIPNSAENSENDAGMMELISDAKKGLQELCSHYHTDYETVLKKFLEVDDTKNDPELIESASITLPLNHALCPPCLRLLAHVGTISEDMDALTQTRLANLEGLGQIMTFSRNRRRDWTLLGGGGLSGPPPPKRNRLTQDDTGDSDGDSMYGETNPWAQFRKAIVRNYIKIFGPPPEILEDYSNPYDFLSSSSSSSSSSGESESDISSDGGKTEKCDSSDVVPKDVQTKDDHSDNNSHLSTTSTEAEVSSEEQSKNHKNKKYINDLRRPLDASAEYESDSDDSITDHILDLGRVKTTHLAKAKELKNHCVETGGRLICDNCGVWITLKRISSRENAELKMIMHIFNRHFPEYHNL